MLASCQNKQSNTDASDMAKYAKDNEALQSKVNVNRVVLMGDSITEFWSRENPSFFEGKPIVNRGISGQTTPQMLLRFRADVIDLQPAAVVILAGINDIAENTGPISLEEIFANIVTMVEMARKSNIKVILSSVLPAADFPWRRDLKPAKKVIKLNAMLRSYADQQHLEFVDYFSAMADEKNGLNKTFSSDGVHPNSAGYKVMEPLLEQAIEKTLSKK